jgi:hypothetical protein
MKEKAAIRSHKWRDAVPQIYPIPRSEMNSSSTLIINNGGNGIYAPAALPLPFYLCRATRAESDTEMGRDSNARKLIPIPPPSPIARPNTPRFQSLLT